ncbi:Ig-like domain-containing protein, partial [Vibrio vulnificus]
MMNQFFKSLFTLMILSIILNGCNSEGAFSELAVKLERIDIVASPITTRGVSELGLAKGNKQPFEAIGYYSDGSSRLLTNLSWHTSDLGVGHFDELGTFTADEVGKIEVYASKNGVTSNRVNITVTDAIITGITVTPPSVSGAK